jgi:hypothetical protein
MHLGKLIQHKYTDPIAPLCTEAAQKALDDMKCAIISNPCLQRFDHRKLVMLRTNFSSLGFGHVLRQTHNNAASTQALLDYWEVKGFLFMMKKLTALLHPVCFGACKCRGNYVWLHSVLSHSLVLRNTVLGKSLRVGANYEKVMIN